MPLHLIKLAVGAASLQDVAAWQQARAARTPPLRHRTRNFPRRAAEILDGGSIFWVVRGVVTARQRVLDILQAQEPDGRACADIVLDPLLVPVRPRPHKPFQGWRYLAAPDAPPDDEAGQTEAHLPEAMRRELQVLGLL